MKILVVHDRLAPGDGSSRYLRAVVERLCFLGHDVSVACPDVQLPLHPHAERAPLHRDGYDVLFGSHLPALVLRMSDAKRLVYAPLGSLPWLEAPEGEAELRPLEARVLARCDALLRFTSAGVSLLERTYGVGLRERAHVAPWFHGAPDTPEQLRLERPSRTLLWVGRLTPTKDVAFLLEALAQSRTPEVWLDVVGDGPERAALSEQAERLGIHERVRFRGYLEDDVLEAAYRSASLFLTASRVEHYSLTLMEAYGVGTPCIGRRPDMRTVFNACDEQIDTGISGLLVDTPTQLAASIDACLADETVRQEMGRRGWERYREAHAADAFGQALASAIG